MAFTKIPPKGNLAPQVYQQLRRAILRGKLEPGTRLVETRIGEQLGVSRTPVREAISRLVAQGFVKETTSGARVVADMEVELQQIFALRQVLEGFAARLAAENATDEELEEIERLSIASARAVDEASIAERAALNSVFHASIARASHNDRLIKIIGEFYEYVITEEMLPFFGREGTHNHIVQHDAIVGAIKARDGQGAETAMRAHLSAVVSMVSEAIRGVREQTGDLEELDAIDDVAIARMVNDFTS